MSDEFQDDGNPIGACFILGIIEVASCLLVVLVLKLWVL